MLVELVARPHCHINDAIKYAYTMKCKVFFFLRKIIINIKMSSAAVVISTLRIKILISFQICTLSIYRVRPAYM